jgi:hypothetical protein
MTALLMKKIILLLFLFFLKFSISQVPGYSFGKQIIIDSSKVFGSDYLLNFPVLISITDPDLRTTANGGRITNDNGYDITFTSDDCFTQLSYDIESYSATTGEFNIWIKIPSLPTNTDYGLYMYYGNPSVSANPSTPNTWRSEYDGVWHLHNDFLDASGSGNNGINNGSLNTSPSVIADGQNFNRPNNWISITNHPNRTNSFSYSGWFNTDNNSAAHQRVICDDQSNHRGGHAVSLGDPGSGRLRFYIRGLIPRRLNSPNMIVNNTWYHFTATYNESTGEKLLYINGAQVASQIATGTLVAETGNASIGGENSSSISNELNNRFSGNIDEIRAYQGILSPEWIQTEYTNQNNPSGFYSISAEYTADELCLTLPIELIQFKAEVINKTVVKLKWTTGTEHNNSHFLVQRSKNGNVWQVLDTIKGAGKSTSLKEYDYLDQRPYFGISYYRLKQEDYNGNFSFSEIESVELLSDVLKKVVLFPNPAKNNITLKGNSFELNEIKLYNLIGQEMNKNIIITKISPNKYSLTLSSLSPGGYILKTKTESHKVYKY